MDIDMHYYGTYALARAAGLRADVSHRLATAAEFVDDSTDNEVIENPQGARFRGESTAHHPTDFAPNNDRDDQLTVWVPFHFLPGAEGDTQSRRLVCVKDSAVAKEMVQHHLKMSESPFAIELMGITAHVYADTFAHYGFSGVSSRGNRVANGSIDLKNGDPLAGSLDRFVGKFGTQGGLLKNFRQVITTVVSNIAEDTTGALGHGAVATFPDQPYLEWAYSYEFPEIAGQTIVERKNVNDFMEAAFALHAMFRAFATNRPDLVSEKGHMEFESIKATVGEVLSLVAERDDRIAAWKEALAVGKLSQDPDNSLEDYSHQAWRNQMASLATLDQPEEASSVPVYHFQQAAAVHKHFVLRELLPAHGIYVI